MLLLIRFNLVTVLCINATSQSCATKSPFNKSNVAVTCIYTDPLLLVDVCISFASALSSGRKPSLYGQLVSITLQIM